MPDDVSWRRGLFGIALALMALGATAMADEFNLPPKTYNRTASVLGHRIFYREAGDPAKSTIVLLHGFPASSHSYRELIPMLSRDYHVIAPDYLGSGYSDRPDPDVEPYTFDKLADHVEGLLKALKIDRYTLYMQDFGSPVGFRLIERNPDAIDAIISQNANAYLDGLTPERREFFRKAHEDKSPAEVASLFARMGPGRHHQWAVSARCGARAPRHHEPRQLDARSLLPAHRERPEDSGAALPGLPEQYRPLSGLAGADAQRQFPALIVWGRNDPAFIAPGAEAYLRDLPKAELHLIDAGHFAVEEQAPLIAGYILAFMRRR